MAKNCGKHFKCVPKDAYTPLQATTMGIIAGVLIGGSLLIDPLLGAVAGALIIAAIWDLCRFLHGGKLVCLEEKVCVIGKVMEFIDVWEDKDYLERMDDDFSINILLSPHTGDPATEVHTEPATLTTDHNYIVTEDKVQGHLITEQPALIPAGIGYEQESHEGNTLHCEIKGCGVHDMCIALKIIGVAAAVAAAGCGFLGPLGCLLALLLIALIALIVHEIITQNTHHGHQDDVLDPASGTVVEGDVVLMKGDWVMDTGHAGWNEIHPVRYLLKLTDEIDPKYLGMNTDAAGDLLKADASLIEAFKKEVLDIWCGLAKEADDPIVVEAQKDPLNGWGIHPCIDGCEEPPIIK